LTSKRVPRISYQPTEDQHEYLEGIKRKYGIFKSQYVSNLVKVEMEKGEDRLRPILSIGVASDDVPIRPVPRSHVIGLPSSLPPIRVPFGTKSVTIGDIMDVNAEMKQVFARRKVEQRV